MQSSSSFSSLHISSLHDHIFVVVVLVVSMVLFILLTTSTLKYFINKMLVSSETLEFVWTLLPMIVLASLAVPSLQTLYLLEEVFDPLVTMKIVGHQWYWSYQISGLGVSFDSYMVPTSDIANDGFRLLEVDSNVVVPQGLSTRLIVTSSDVVHSWTVPCLGSKVDAIPGRLNQTSILPLMSGLFFGQCSEICGAFHSFMPICVEAVPPKVFSSWVKSL